MSPARTRRYQRTPFYGVRRRGVTWATKHWQAARTDARTVIEPARSAAEPYKSAAQPQP